jgi:hypothetical protein
MLERRYKDYHEHCRRHPFINPKTNPVSKEQLLRQMTASNLLAKIDEPIRNYIQDTPFLQCVESDFTFAPNHRLRVCVALFSKNILDFVYRQVHDWFGYAFSLVKEKHDEKEKTVYLVLTPLTKWVSNDKTEIDTYHVNSGFTYGEHTIVIYRLEEWFKLLIHESYHALKLDWSFAEEEFHIERIFPLVPPSTKVFLYETYTEFWAEIWYCLITTKTNRKTNRKTRRKHAVFMSAIRHQIQYSIQQAIHVLRIQMQMSYHDFVFPKSKKVYAEKTPILAYHVLKAIAMIHLEEWLHLCRSLEPNIQALDQDQWRAIQRFFESKARDPKTLGRFRTTLSRFHNKRTAVKRRLSLRMLSPLLD